MDFLELLTGDGSSLWQSTNKVCFKNNASSPLFFQQILKQMEETKSLPAERLKLNLDSIDFKTLFSTLSQSVLGSTNFFWLGEIDLDSKDKKQKEFVNYILNYDGPNFIAFSTSTESSKLTFKNGVVVKIENNINIDLFEKLKLFFNINFTSLKAEVIKIFFKQVKTIQLDAACMLLNYIELVSARFTDEYLRYLLTLYGETPSLNLLSESFFSKKANDFFNVWGKVHGEYTDIFWLVFWSDQIWRAHNFIKNIENKNFIEAKKSSSRLPFSFTNTHWQKHKCSDLAKCYNFLYSVDYKIKRGSQFCALDFFYLKYFLGKMS
jgi:hypothetical protein